MKLLRHLNFLSFQISSQKLRVYYKEHLGFGEIDYVLNVHSIGIVPVAARHSKYLRGCGRARSRQNKTRYYIYNILWQWLLAPITRRNIMATC